MESNSVIRIEYLDEEDDSKDKDFRPERGGDRAGESSRPKKPRSSGTSQCYSDQKLMRKYLYQELLMNSSQTRYQGPTTILPPWHG
jgi:hypothetical protein